MQLKKNQDKHEVRKANITKIMKWKQNKNKNERIMK